MIKFVRDENNNPGRLEPAEKIAKDGGYSRALAYMLCLRGIKSAEEAEEFLSPNEEQFLDPYGLPDMKLAAMRIIRALKAKEQICVFGDYDVDGMTATAIMQMYLKHVGGKVTHYIPSRQEGYGMAEASVKKIADMGVTLIITVDNGITAEKEVEFAKSLGIDVIITDHHKCHETLPKACAVVCQTRPDSTYKNKNLCGAGIAFKVVQALSGTEAAMSYIVFAGLATVADSVPLTGENRAMVYWALKAINSGECPISLNELAMNTGVYGKKITERELGFVFAPRLNAAGRLLHAEYGLELLLCQDTAEAACISQELSLLNDERRDEENKIFNEAERMLALVRMDKIRAIVLKSEDWNEGVIGIAASRLTEQYNRPTILFADKGEYMVGSARSIDGVDIHDALNRFRALYTRFGGHPYAAGLTMPSENFDELATGLNDYLFKNIDKEAFIPKRKYDIELEFSDLTEEFTETLARLAPFGEGNPLPAILTRDASVMQVRKIGRDAIHLNGRMFKNNNGKGFVWFSAAKHFQELVNCDNADVLYTPTLNVWNGHTSVQLQVSYAQRHVENDSIDALIDKNKQAFPLAFAKNVCYNCRHIINDANLEKSAKRVCIDELIQERLNGNIEGALIVCFSESGARKLMSEYDLSAWDIWFGAVEETPCAYNAVLLAPVVKLFGYAARKYSDIIIADDVPFEGILSEMLTCSPNSDIYISKERTPGLFSDCINMFEKSITREKFAAKYKRVRSVLSNGEVSILCLADRASDTEYDRAILETAVNTFYELGFVTKGAGGGIKNCTDLSGSKRDLTESSVYQSAINVRKACDDWLGNG